MGVKKWGSVYWKLFHTITSLYPSNPTDVDKRNALNFINSFSGIIPCGACVHHYKTNLQKFPIKDALNSQEKFVKWLIDFHNLVNSLTKKTILPYNNALEQVKKFAKVNLTQQMRDVFVYVIYAIPEDQQLVLHRKNEIKEFVKSLLYFAQINEDSNKINLNSRAEFEQSINKTLNIKIVTKSKKNKAAKTKKINKPMIKPVAKPAAKPVAKPAAKPAAKLAVKKIIKQTGKRIKPMPKQQNKQIFAQIITQIIKPVINSQHERNVKPITKKMFLTMAKPIIKPVSKPINKKIM